MRGAMDATVLTEWNYVKGKGDVVATVTRTTVMDGAMDATMMAPWCFDFYSRSVLRHRRDWTFSGAAPAP